MAAMPIIEFLGNVTRFGSLTVVREVDRAGSQRRVECRCDCGQNKIVYAQHLKRGNSRSCGCKIIVGKATHGKFYEPGYSIWNAMMQRCGNPKNKHFTDYGGRGIHVCERWHNVANFLADMGPPPSGHSIDRINNDGDYEPGNVRWADARTQAQNKRGSKMVEIGGEKMVLAEACRRLNVVDQFYRIYARMRKGKTFEEALE